MTLDVERYSVGRAASVTYGPLGAEPEPWTLRFATEGGERVVVRLDREAMYELWTEVRGVPWPTVHRDPERREKDELVRELVERANVADATQLREALDTLGGEER
ncbi:hypothetical protein QTL95_16100 [Rhizobium sp. S152]|uniref:Uncharacterized protein n=1 Tax=Halobaculum lipolyticum TaxID=3032001 RepID=A0ABD5W465_9EURY|nr:MULTISPECIES: hypothetical protein [Bacteria]MDM9627431.1 hypothetical protein [Rhizobium sp. S152]